MFSIIGTYMYVYNIVHSFDLVLIQQSRTCPIFAVYLSSSTCTGQNSRFKECCCHQSWTHYLNYAQSQAARGNTEQACNAGLWQRWLAFSHGAMIQKLLLLSLKQGHNQYTENKYKVTKNTFYSQYGQTFIGILVSTNWWNNNFVIYSPTEFRTQHNYFRWQIGLEVPACWSELSRPKPRLESHSHKVYTKRHTMQFKSIIELDTTSAKHPYSTWELKITKTKKKLK